MEYKPELIKSCVEKVLNESFPNIKVYKDIQEGMENPCFFISVIEVNQKRETLSITSRTHTLSIQYQSSEKSVVSDEVISELFSILPIIHDENLKLKANSIKSSVENGILQVLVEYSVKLRRSQNNEIKMTKVKGKEGVKQ